MVSKTPQNTDQRPTGQTWSINTPPCVSPNVIDVFLALGLHPATALSTFNVILHRSVTVNQQGPTNIPAEGFLLTWGLWMVKDNNSKYCSKCSFLGPLVKWRAFQTQRQRSTTASVDDFYGLWITRRGREQRVLGVERGIWLLEALPQTRCLDCLETSQTSLSLGKTAANEPSWPAGSY